MIYVMTLLHSRVDDLRMKIGVAKKMVLLLGTATL